MPLVFDSGQTVLFTGDSITDCDRRGAAAPLGNGYVRMAVDLITCRYPELRLNFLNTGVSGNTVREVLARADEDVIAPQPDWLSIKIGINDAWRWVSGQGPAAVSPEQYAQLYEALLTRVQQQTSARLILMEPFYISTAHGSETDQGEMLRHLPDYLSTVHRLAETFGAVLVRTQEMFAGLLRHHEPQHFCPEPVHPYAGGHTAVAHAWLSAVGW